MAEAEKWGRCGNGAEAGMGPKRDFVCATTVKFVGLPAFEHALLHLHHVEYLRRVLHRRRSRAFERRLQL